MHYSSRFDRALQKPLRRTGDVPARLLQPAGKLSSRAALFGTATLPSVTRSGLCLGAAVPIALGLGLAGLPIAASAACLPGATTACSAPGGIGEPGRSGSGGAGNGDGGGTSILSGSDTIVVPGLPGSGGNGGKGADGDNTGGDGGAVGLAIGGSIAINANLPGAAGQARPTSANFGAGGGGGGTGLYFSGFELTISPSGSVQGGAGGVGGATFNTGSGNGGGGGGGGTGIASVAAGAQITNNGSIIGGRGGDGGDGGFGGGGGGGGDGLMVFGVNSFITNIGTITGGIGGFGGFGNSSGRVGSGFSGAGVNLAGSGSALANVGTIVGGAGNDAPAGAGIIARGNATITNAGTISGGLYSDGITRASAIQFEGTGNTLNLLAGSNMSGDLSLAPGAGATIAPQNAGLTLGNRISLGSAASAVTFNVTSSGPSTPMNLLASGAISGSGTVTKTGSGILTLTGANTYTGGTTLSAGTLAVGHSAALGTGALNMASGTVLQATTTGLSLANPITMAGGMGFIDDQGTVLTLSGAVSGAGGLTKLGTGRVLLSSANTYAGGTIVNGGWLYADGAGTLGTGAVTVNGGYLQLQNGFNASGMVFSTANGYTFFTGTATAGNAVLTADAGGVTSFQDGSNAGSSIVVTNAGGLTEFWGWSTGSNAQLVTYAGGVVDFSGSAGPAFDRKLTAGSIEGGGTFQLGANALTVGANGQSTTVGGVIEDGGAGGGTGGSLIKTGTGTLTLSGANTYSGGTVVQDGKLVVNGSLVSAVTVNGGALGGIGRIGGLSVQSGGFVKPGNSIGTLNVAGNVAFGPGSFYAVEIDGAGRSDRIAATGAASLTGGTVTILPDAGVNFVADTPYTILTASGGVTGTFAGLQSSEFAFISPTLGYSTDAVTLTMVRKTEQPPAPQPPAPRPLAFHSVAVTKNQYRTADAIEALRAGNRLYNTVLGASVVGARQAFDALSGEAHAGAVTAAYGDARLVETALLARLRQPLIGSSVPLLAQGPYPAAFAADRPGTAPQPVALAPVEPRYALWGEGFGAWGRRRSDGNAASLATATGGFLLGADALVSDGLRLGLAGGFTRTRFDVDARLSSGTSESVVGALYGTGSWGDLNLRLGAAYARHDIATRRSIAFPGFADAVSAAYDGSTLQAFGEIGYRIGLGAAALEPFAGASVLRLDTDRFQETGGAAALTGFGQRFDLATTTVGLRGAAQIGDQGPLTLRGLLGWRHAYGDVAPAALLAFAGGTSPFAVAGVPLDRDALVAEAGLAWQAADRLSLGLSYSGQIGRRAQDHTLKANLLWTFNTH